PGTYTVVYTATVDADATGALGNHVTATGGGGTTGPDCSACSTEHVVASPVITVAKSADPAGGEVAPGQTLTYTLAASVAVSATTEPLVLSDVLDAGLTFGGVESATGFSCSGSLECTLPAGTLPGTYTVVYTATVDADATGALGNHVTATGGGGTTGPDCSACSTEHVVASPVITVAKSADPAGGEVAPGQTLTYTLAASVAVSATTEPLVLSDVLDAGLTFGGVESATGFSCSGSLECTLPAGTLPGTYTVVYTATVDADATGTLGNHVTATGGGGTTGPDCSACSTEHVVASPVITVAKSADPAGGEVAPGQTLTYTLAASVAV